MQEKIIIYSALTRLWGNKQTTRKPHGSLAENGAGKMGDFTPEALAYIRSLGATHVWYIGLLEHATKTNYSCYGIRPDHPDTVKGVAGSPYAVKDYYDIDPDLAEDPHERQGEFDALIERTHRAGLRVLMDFIPNHVARTYHSDTCPTGVEDLGATDDVQRAFSPSNNFYYLPDQALTLPLSTESSPYREYPARATGNDCFSPSPSINDWYETVKLNYGVDYCGGSDLHADPIPDTWVKMRDILCYWAGRGVDGFRCDMTELVPPAFWAWAIPSVREQYPQTLFLAEIISPTAMGNICVLALTISTTKSGSMTSSLPSARVSVMRLTSPPFVMLSVATKQRCATSQRTTMSSDSPRTSSSLRHSRASSLRLLQHSVEVIPSSCISVRSLESKGWIRRASVAVMGARPSSTIGASTSSSVWRQGTTPPHS